MKGYNAQVFLKEVKLVNVVGVGSREEAGGSSWLYRWSMSLGGIKVGISHLNGDILGYFLQNNRVTELNLGFNYISRAILKKWSISKNF